MIVLPAIDIKGGKCVRLKQGILSQETAYYDDPVAVAKMWEEKGAEYLHIVDLDGAFSGNQVNMNIIEQITQSVSIPIEVGGGIRTKEAIEKYINIGVSRVILGTKAVEDNHFVKEISNKYPGKIAVSIDAKGDYVAIKGWVETSEVQVLPFCKELYASGVETIIYTDISRDGMLSGPNLGMLQQLNEAVDADIIASGGVANIQNIKDLIQLDLYGAITGKALYEGTLTMEEIITL